MLKAGEDGAPIAREEGVLMAGEEGILNDGEDRLLMAREVESTTALVVSFMTNEKRSKKEVTDTM